MQNLRAIVKLISSQKTILSVSPSYLIKSEIQTQIIQHKYFFVLTFLALLATILHKQNNKNVIQKKVFSFLNQKLM